ncbi:MAG: SDR family oxidoreductase [Pirellulaceae bacterium]
MTASISPHIQQLFDLSGRTAMITGARGHLGCALADALAEAGARVVVSSRTLEHARTAAAALGGKEAGHHLAICLDYLDETSIERGFESAVEQAGQIDILVNNGHDPLGADWSTVTGEQFQRQLANLTGYFLLARKLRDHAVKQRRPASVILLGSMYGVVGSYPDAYEGICAASPAAYHALKGGIVHLTRHLAVYWGKEGVRVNCLSPGPFPGPQAPAALVERLNTKSPLGRMGSPHELKGAIVFLASDASSYMTGQNLIVDGGWTAW